MRKGLLLVAMTVGFSALAQNGPKRPAAGDFARVSQQWVAAFRAKDAAKVASLYAEDGALMPPNHEAVKGGVNIQKFVEEMISAVSDAKGSTIQEQKSGSIGYEVGEYSLSRKSPDGKTATDTGKYVVVYKPPPAPAKSM